MPSGRIVAVPWVGPLQIRIASIVALVPLSSFVITGRNVVSPASTV